MSLPIYLLPYEKDIIQELKLQGANDKTIKSIIFDFKGRKREEELLKYLRENRENNITIQDLISKKMEIKNKYDMWWGYVIDSDDCEYYNPEEYLKNMQN